MGTWWGSSRIIYLLVPSKISKSWTSPISCHKRCLRPEKIWILLLHSWKNSVSRDGESYLTVAVNSLPFWHKYMFIVLTINCYEFLYPVLKQFNGKPVWRNETSSSASLFCRTFWNRRNTGTHDQQHWFRQSSHSNNTRCSLNHFISTQFAL